MSKLNVSRRSADNGVAIIDLAGDVTIGGGNKLLQQTVRSLVADGQKQIILNLADVSYIDSSGLGELVASFTTIEKSGGEMKLLNLTKRVTELMVITKLLTVFDVYESEATAVAAFGTKGSELTTGPLNPSGLTEGATV